MKRELSVLISMLLLAACVNSSCPSTSEFRSAVIFAIDDYLGENSAGLTLAEVSDLIEFYLSKKLSEADCSSIGTQSRKSIDSILDKTESCPTLTSVKAYPSPASTTITFEAIGSQIEQIQVKIYDLSGSLAFDSGWQTGTTYTWNLKNSNGQDVANGVYLYKIYVTGCGNQKGSSTGKFSVSRGSATTTTTVDTTKCVDQDNGQNYDVKASCTSPYGYPGTDKCLDWQLVREYYCLDQSSCWFYDYPCPIGCEDGKCKSSATTTTVDTNTCAGYCQATYNTQGECKTGLFCPSGWWHPSTTGLCTSAQCCCKERLKCVDTDGEDKYTKGKITIYKADGSVGSEAPDYCSSSLGAVYERYCIKEYGDYGEIIGDTKTLQCDSGKKCSDGACAGGGTTTTIDPNKCVDSDGGVNYDVKGTCTSPQGQPGTDYCWGGSSLREYSCNTADDKSCTYEDHPCPYGCSGDRCLPKETTTPGQTTTTLANAYTCTDSDGGSNQYVQGTVTVKKPDGSVYKTGGPDKCSGSNVIEYNCPQTSSQSPFDPYSLQISCTNGCSNGACKQQITTTQTGKTTTTTIGLYTCTDSDGGSNQYVQGTVTVKKPDGSLYKTGTDKCSGSKVVEYNCPQTSSQSPFDPYSLEISCTNGCSSGACKQAATTTTTKKTTTTTVKKTTTTIKKISMEEEQNSCELECMSRNYSNSECSLIPCFFLGKESIGQYNCGFLQSCCCW